MKKLLVTAFEPYGGNTVNTALELMKGLPDVINGFEVEKLVLPFEYDRGEAILKERLKNTDYDAVIALGFAENKRSMTPEKIAINWKAAKQADNANIMYCGAKVDEKGPDGIFSMLPTRNMVHKIREYGVKSETSYSAGTFVGNTIMYTILLFLNENRISIPAGFISVPPAREFEMKKADKGVLPTLEQLTNAFIGACSLL